jgi:hypothetical protein
LENGAKNATPRPPLVIESSNPCEAVAMKKNGQSLAAPGLSGQV